MKAKPAVRHSVKRTMANTSRISFPRVSVLNTIVGTNAQKHGTSKDTRFKHKTAHFVCIILSSFAHKKQSRETNPFKICVDGSLDIDLQTIIL